MKPRSILIATLTLLATALAPCVEANTIEMPSYGFEIDALDGTVGDTPVQALMMFLPSVERFAANVNVQIQPYKGTMKDYAALSKGQFEEVKWKVISERLNGENEWVAEYAGQMQGNDLHFYARALLKGGRVYLVTGTAKESQWKNVEATLRKHVDSMKLK